MNISEKLNRAISKGPNTGDDDLDDAILEVLQLAQRNYILEDYGAYGDEFAQDWPEMIALADAILKEDK